MNTRRLYQLSGFALIASGSLYLIWWGLMATLMPADAANFKLVDMVRKENWLAFNAVGSLATILFPPGLIGLYARQSGTTGLAGFTGFLLALVGSFLYIWIQVEETLLWPLLAVHAPQLIDMQGPMFTDQAFFATYILMGALFIPGTMLLGIVTMRAGIFTLWGALLFTIGAPIFGLGGLINPIVRTVGMLLFAPGAIWLGISVWRDRG